MLFCKKLAFDPFTKGIQGGGGDKEICFVGKSKGIANMETSQIVIKVSIDFKQRPKQYWGRNFPWELNPIGRKKGGKFLKPGGIGRPCSPHTLGCNALPYCYCY